jgi:hypothetical protein
MTKANNFEPLDIEGENACKGKKKPTANKIFFCFEIK